MSQVAASVTIVAKEGSADALAALLGRLHQEVSAEPGCDLYTVFRNDRSPEEFVIVEMYRDRDALRAHRKNERLDALSAELPDLATSITVTLGAVVVGDEARRL